MHVPAVGAHGGVVARGPIQRDVTVNFVALRRLKGGNSTALRHYILGLALVAAIEPIDGFLRAGCLLTLDPTSEAEWKLVHRDGKRDPVALDPAVIKTYAQDRANAFGKGPDRPVTFDRRARQGRRPQEPTKKPRPAETRLHALPPHLRALP